VSRPERLPHEQVKTWLDSHDGWAAIDGHLLREYAVSYDSGLRATRAADATVVRIDHHPRVTIEFARLTVELWTHDRGGITSLDLELAEAFDAAVENEVGSVL
jgi:4a-hydroxytetrahydrobiopterin dehydratase